jgi:predicted GH43/DUF377 family glycosyl hydrolase
MLRRLWILALLPIALHAQQSKFGEWKVDNLPALSPGNPPAWDDFAIASASVTRLPEKWLMLYEGVSLNEDGESHAFGAAESADGVKWNKRPENPVFVPSEHEWEIVTAPSITRWRDDWIALYMVNRGLAFQEKTPEDFNLPQEWVRLARSADGLNWETLAEIKGIPFKQTKHARLRPCIYSDRDALHIWWIGAGDQDEPALLHSVSRDGEKWSKPNQQLTSEIDSRHMACARVQPSGDYYILTYLAFDEKNGPRLVTKVSQNARTWAASGLPDFSLPAYFNYTVKREQAVPSIIFSKEGARLFYVDLLFGRDTQQPNPWQDAARGAVLRTAFSPKQP